MDAGQGPLETNNPRESLLVLAAARVPRDGRTSRCALPTCRCDVDIRKDLYSNIVLSGGCCHYCCRGGGCCHCRGVTATRTSCWQGKMLWPLPFACGQLGSSQHAPPANALSWEPTLFWTPTPPLPPPLLAPQAARPCSPASPTA